MPEPAIDTTLNQPPTDPPAADPNAAPGVPPSAAPTPPADPGAAPPVNPPADPPPGYFKQMPDDWRDQVAGENEAFRKHLNRVSDFDTLAKNYWSAQEKIRKGEISTGLPEDPTDEQLANWREAHGVPETPEKYELSLDEGLVLGESDERIMEGIYKVAHEENVSSGVISKLTNEMLLGRQREQQALEARDNVDKQATDQLLRETWGGEYQANVERVNNTLNKMLTPEMKELFINGRMADGKAYFNSPEIMVGLERLARQADPGGTVVPDAINQPQAIADELASFDSGKHPRWPGLEMGSPEWYRNEEAQSRWRDLYNAREQMNRRS